MAQQAISSAHDSQTPPPEIFNIIIADLEAELTPKELRACYAKIGLIWKEYLPYVRSRLFHKVDIGYPDLQHGTIHQELSTLGWPSGLPVPFKRVDERRIKLAQLIMARPSLAEEIRHLSYTTAGILVDQAIGKRTDPYVNILLTLPAIQSLSVGNDSHNYFTETPYRGGDPKIFGYQPVLSHYLSTGTLTTLSLVAIGNIPIFDILRSSALRSLVMDGCHMVEWTPPSPRYTVDGSEVQPYIKLRNLSIRNMGYEWCRILPYLKELIRLKYQVPFRSNNVVRVPPLQQKPMFRKLQVLHYENENDISNWTNLVNLLKGDGTLHFPALKRLTFDMSQNGTSQYLRSMDDLNNLLQNSPSVEVCTLKVNGVVLNVLQGLKLDNMLPNCRDLTIDIGDSHYRFQNLFESITQKFRLKKGNLQLRTFQLYFRLVEEHPLNRVVFPSAHEGGPWTGFAETLCRNRARFPYLQRVSINISIMRAQPYESPSTMITSDDVAAFRASLAKVLQQSTKGSRLEIISDVYYVKDGYIRDLD